MKICLIGHFTDDLDEGVRIVGKNMAKELERYGFEIKKVNISSVFSRNEISDFNPDVIHFVMSPTIMGLIIAKFISILHSKQKVVISAIHPSIPNWKLLQILKPDLILIQSEESKKLFEYIGYRTKFLSNGVDTNKFKPVDIKIKTELRGSFGLPQDKFIILHLASLTKERNLNVFKEIQKQDGNQVVIIGRENKIADNQVISDLREAGCIIWIKHFQKIEEIYNMSDCYVFPTINKKACIEMPLSVLESMACNLPVITTKFGGITKVFESGGGLFFTENIDDTYKAIDMIKTQKIEITTREKVLPYSWTNIIEKLDVFYEELLH
jgi:glycosyltransferase involved in cell wall biosynthesis